MIGRATVRSFQSAGHEVVALVREKSTRSDIEAIVWSPASKALDLSRITGFDCVVHLAGENIATGRWTNEKKRRIRESRVCDTHFLVDSLARLQHPPKTFLCASAVGYYGDRGEELLDETSTPGHGFLSYLCREWEDATDVARNHMRVVNMRIGVVLSPKGGALKSMLRPFKMGLGAPLGDGRQFMSWIDLSDVVRAIRFLAEEASLSGPVNLVAPNPVTNRQFTAALQRRVSRAWMAPLAPLRWKIPSPVLHAVLGEMADELLLASTRVAPAKLLSHSFEFQFPDIASSLEAMNV